MSLLSMVSTLWVGEGLDGKWRQMLSYGTGCNTQNKPYLVGDVTDHTFLSWP